MSKISLMMLLPVLIMVGACSSGHKPPPTGKVDAFARNTAQWIPPPPDELDVVVMTFRSRNTYAPEVIAGAPATARGAYAGAIAAAIAGAVAANRGAYAGALAVSRHANQWNHAR